MIAPISLSRSPSKDLSLIFADPKYGTVSARGEWVTNYSESIIDDQKLRVRIDYSLMDSAVELFVSSVAREVDVIFNPKNQATIC